MGYVRMQQSNFGGAISFLEQAKQYGARDAGLDTALETARFYSTMGEGQIALNENDLTTAEQKYQAALVLRPNSPEALEGLGGTLLKAQQAEAAVQVFDRYTQGEAVVNRRMAWTLHGAVQRRQCSAAPADGAQHSTSRAHAADEGSRLSSHAGLGLLGRGPRR